MKIFDAVYTAAVFLGLDSLCDAFNAEGFEPSEWRDLLENDDAKETDILVRCCNLVLHEISAEYIPLRATEELSAPGGKIKYADFTHKVTDIYSATADGSKLRIREFHDCIIVPHSGKVTVDYAYEPIGVDLGDDSPYERDKPSARLLAYGIAREYCLISGMTDDASIWDSRFTACAQEESRPKRERRVRARKWR